MPNSDPGMTRPHVRGHLSRRKEVKWSPRGVAAAFCPAAHPHQSLHDPV